MNLTSAQLHAAISALRRGADRAADAGKTDLIRRKWALMGHYSNELVRRNDRKQGRN